MTASTCAAFVLAGTLVAPHYHSQPISTPKMAMSAAYEQLNEIGFRYGNKEAFAAAFIPKRIGDTWILRRGGNGNMSIYLDAQNGCVLRVMVID